MTWGLENIRFEDMQGKNEILSNSRRPAGGPLHPVFCLLVQIRKVRLLEAGFRLDKEMAFVYSFPSVETAWSAENLILAASAKRFTLPLSFLGNASIFTIASGT